MLGARCSHEVHRRLNGYPKQFGVQLTMHMGLGAGRITNLYIGGTFGRWEHVVAGGPMAQIAVAEPLAGHGQTVFSPQVYELLADECSCVPVDWPNETYMVQGAFKTPEDKLAPLDHLVARRIELEDQHIELTKFLLPNAVYNTLKCGYDPFYLAEMRELSVLFIKVSIGTAFYFNKHCIVVG
jgi:hypothetical protein